MPFTALSPPEFSLDGRQFKHREIVYGPVHLRTIREKLYILTDKPQWVVPEFAAVTDGVLTDLDAMVDDDIAKSAFYICFSLHDLALPSLSRIVHGGGVFAPPPWFRKPPYQDVNAHALASYNKTGETLGEAPLMACDVHAQICQAIEITRDLPGEYVEIGVFSGSSALTALNYMTRTGIKRRCWLFDTFSGFTYPTAQDSPDIIWAGTHLMDPAKTVDRIADLMETTGQEYHVRPLEICSADFPDELGPIAVANLDVDMYEAISAGLSKLAPKVVHRGIIIVDDASSLPGIYGGYLAMHEFLKTDMGRKFIPVRTAMQHFLIRAEA